MIFNAFDHVQMAAAMVAQGTHCLCTLDRSASCLPTGSFRIVSAQIRDLKTIISAPIFRAIYCVSTSTQFCWTHLSRCVGRWLCMHACARLGCNAMQPSLDRFVNTMLAIAGLRFQLSQKIDTSSLSPVVLARLDWALASGCVERCGLLSGCVRLAHRKKEL